MHLEVHLDARVGERVAHMSNESLLDVYIYENTQLLEQLEELLLAAEQEKTFQSAQVDEIFRIMHTIKGASAMMSFASITKVSHAVEDLFSQIRENRIDMQGSRGERIFDIVLSAGDYLKEQTNAIASTGAETADDIEKLIADIEALAGEGSGSQDQDTASKQPGHNAQGAPAAIEGGRIFRARVFFEEESRMENVRAFGIVNSIADRCAAIAHIPQDLLAPDADEQIAERGFLLYGLTQDELDKIHERIAQALFVKSLEFGELAQDDPQIPASLQQQAGVKAASGAVAAAKRPPGEGAARTAAAQPLAEGQRQSFISVNISKLDKLMNLVGEIVTAESMVTKNPDLQGVKLDNFEKNARQLRKLTDELQDVVMSIRMVPVSTTFHKMRRIVRDMCKKTGKQAELTIIGEQTEVDKNIIDRLSDPLMHIIRNSMDHGIALPEARMRQGKSATGEITLEARNTGSDIMILISDDGRGLDRDKILKKAIDRGLTSAAEADKLSDREVFNFIMLPGFSTNDTVSEYSGRGVGMDVVRKNIEAIGGSISIESARHKGMVTSIKIPLTLAIMDGMLITVGDIVYIVPVLSIRESFKAKPEDIIIDPNGEEMIMIRGEVYPVLRLHEHFNVEPKTRDLPAGIFIMVEDDINEACLFADELVGEQQVVIKPLPGYLQHVSKGVRGLGGCAIMGDGSISLIMDISGLLA